MSRRSAFWLRHFRIGRAYRQRPRAARAVGGGPLRCSGVADSRELAAASWVALRVCAPSQLRSRNVDRRIQEFSFWILPRAVRKIFATIVRARFVVAALAA